MNFEDGRFQIACHNGFNRFQKKSVTCDSGSTARAHRSCMCLWDWLASWDTCRLSVATYNFFQYCSASKRIMQHALAAFWLAIVASTPSGPMVQTASTQPLAPFSLFVFCACRQHVQLKVFVVSFDSSSKPCNVRASVRQSVCPSLRPSVHR